MGALSSQLMASRGTKGPDICSLQFWQRRTAKVRGGEGLLGSLPFLEELHEWCMFFLTFCAERLGGFKHHQPLAFFAAKKPYPALSISGERAEMTSLSSFHYLVIALVTALVLAPVDGGVLFSSLRRSLVIQASPKAGDVLKAGEDKIEVTWALNQTFSGDADSYKTINVKLCYAPVSQENRGWRKTNNDLHKDKTCQLDIASVPFTAATSSSVEWVVGRDTPTATYFVRAYALDSSGRQVGFGQTTDASKKTNLFRIQGISGRQLWVDVAAGCFSALSVLSLFGFFLVEKRMAKNA